MGVKRRGVNTYLVRLHTPRAAAPKIHRAIGSFRALHPGCALRGHGHRNVLSGSARDRVAAPVRVADEDLRLRGGVFGSGLLRRGRGRFSGTAGKTRDLSDQAVPDLEASTPWFSRGVIGNLGGPKENLMNALCTNTLLGGRFLDCAAEIQHHYSTDHDEGPFFFLVPNGTTSSSLSRTAPGGAVRDKEGCGSTRSTSRPRGVGVVYGPP